MNVLIASVLYVLQVSQENTTIGKDILVTHGLDFDAYYYWISVGALCGFTLLFDLGFLLALTYIKREFDIK